LIVADMMLLLPASRSRVYGLSKQCLYGDIPKEEELVAEIAVIGGGKVGRTLGRAWVEAGHRVRFGSRTPGGEAAATLPGPAALPLEVAEHAEVVVLAVPGSVVREVLSTIAPGLGDTVVIDATNRIGGDPTHAIDLIEELASSSIPFRAFNGLGWETLAAPGFGDDRADLFFCGPDGRARSLVEALIHDVGLRPVWVGDLEHLPIVEGLTRLWFALALERGMGRHLAFRVLTDDGVQPG
jgi:hypothetical protein